MNRFRSKDPYGDDEDTMGFDREPSAMSNIALAIMVWGSFIVVGAAIWCGIAAVMR